MYDKNVAYCLHSLHYILYGDWRSGDIRISMDIILLTNVLLAQLIILCMYILIRRYNDQSVTNSELGSILMQLEVPTLLTLGLRYFLYKVLVTC